MSKRTPKRKDGKDRTVLVAVLKNRRDRDILLKEKWYRIPIEHSPKLGFKHLAFYQPSAFGRQGKRIEYYGSVLNHRVMSRKNLLPAETRHPRAGSAYFQIKFGRIRKLTRPIKNTAPRRVCFGFTGLSRLLKARNMLELYNVTPAEEIVAAGLKQVGIKFVAQHYIVVPPRLDPPKRDKAGPVGKKRFRLDFAVFCRQGKIAIECDNQKAHSNARQKIKDQKKTSFSNKTAGWSFVWPKKTLSPIWKTVLREFKEPFKDSAFRLLKKKKFGLLA